MKKNVVMLLGVVAALILIGFLKDWVYLGDPSNLKIRDLWIWRHTPAWTLALAVKHQNTWQIKRIVKAHSELLNYQEPRFGSTVLIMAVGTEKYKSAETLLQCGADPNIATTHSGETALFVAAGFSWVDNLAKTDPKYVKLLLKYGADPNINYKGFKSIGVIHDITPSGTSPLMYSIGCGIEKTKALVEGGADINYKTASGKTAAVEALDAGSWNVYDTAREYAYYLIVVKKARIVDPYYYNDAASIQLGSDPKKKYYPVDILRHWHPDNNTKGYQMKMAIVKEFARQGVEFHETE